MNLVKLTIKFPEGDNQVMVLEKDSEAYKHMLIYAETNEGETSEKPHLDEKLMAWVLRGFLSTNTWEDIDSLYDAYPERRDDLSVDDYKPSRDEVLDKVFEYFTEDAEEGERRKLWEEINKHIEENA